MKALKQEAFAVNSQNFKKRRGSFMYKISHKIVDINIHKFIVNVITIVIIFLCNSSTMAQIDPVDTLLSGLNVRVESNRLKAEFFSKNPINKTKLITVTASDNRGVGYVSWEANNDGNGNFVAKEGVFSTNTMPNGSIKISVDVPWPDSYDNKKYSVRFWIAKAISVGEPVSSSNYLDFFFEVTGLSNNEIINGKDENIQVQFFDLQGTKLMERPEQEVYIEIRVSNNKIIGTQKKYSNK